jgi:hypothetical protein
LQVTESVFHKIILIKQDKFINLYCFIEDASRLFHCEGMQLLSQEDKK